MRLTWSLANRRVPNATDVAILELLDLYREYVHWSDIYRKVRTGGGDRSKFTSLEVLTSRRFIEKPRSGKDMKNYWRITKKGQNLLEYCKRLGPMIDELEEVFKKS